MLITGETWLAAHGVVGFNSRNLLDNETPLRASHTTVGLAVPGYTAKNLQLLFVWNLNLAIR